MMPLQNLPPTHSHLTMILEADAIATVVMTALHNFTTLSQIRKPFHCNNSIPRSLRLRTSRNQSTLTMAHLIMSRSRTHLHEERSVS